MTTFNKYFITFYLLMVLWQDNVECLRLPAYKQMIYEKYVSVVLTDKERSRRSAGKDVFPEQLTIDFKKTNDDVHLLITRNDKIDVNVPVYHSVTGNKLEIQELPNNKFGSFHIKDEEFYIEPLDIRNTSVDHRIFKTPIAVDFKGDYEIDTDVMKPLAAKKLSNFNRIKRTSTDYNVELFIVADYSIYKFWYDEANLTFTSSEKDAFAKTSIRQFYAFVISGIDVRYKSIMAAPFTISVVFAGLYISDSVATSTWTESIKNTGTIPNQVDSSNGLSNFKSWISSTSGLPEHDHAMLFTRYDLTRNSSTANLGLAYVSAICTLSSQSIVEDHFSFALLTVAAHELGHSLGASHDGEGNNSCNGNDAFIMAASTSFPTGSTAQNPWKFSSCSVTYFQTLVNNLNSRNNNCMVTLNAKYNVSTLYPYDQKIPGQVYDADTQCGYNKGDGSYMCRSLYNGTYTSICNKLWCKIVGTNSCSVSMAGDGTLCGNKKWCLSGACVESSDAASVLDTCPYGNQPGIITNGLTCAQIASTSPWFCYNHATRCCQSCSTIQTNITSCEYGDKASGCNVNNCLSYSDVDKDYCCKTCYVPLTTTSSSTTTAIETTTPVSSETNTVTTTFEATTTQPGTESTITEITTTHAVTKATSTEITTTQVATKITTSKATTTNAATESTTTEATTTNATTETNTIVATTTQTATETTSEASTTQAATETTSESSTSQAANKLTSTEATTTRAATETNTIVATTTQEATETTSEASTTQAATETTSESSTSQAATKLTSTEATTTQAATETNTIVATTTQAATETTSEASTTQAATETTSEASTSQAATKLTSTQATTTNAATETNTIVAKTTQAATETTSEASTSQAATKLTSTEATTTQAATETTTTETTTTKAAIESTSTEATTTQAATEMTTTTTETRTTQAATDSTTALVTKTQAATETTSTGTTTTEASTETISTEATRTQTATEMTTTQSATFTMTGTTSIATATKNTNGNPNMNIQDLILITSASGIGAIVLIIITFVYLACRNKTDKSASSFDSIDDLTVASKTYSNGYSRQIRQAHHLPMSESISLTPGYLHGYDNLGFAQNDTRNTTVCNIYI